MQALDVLQRYPEIASALEDCSRSKRWWVAVSGGADSVALLHIVKAYLNQIVTGPSDDLTDSAQPGRVRPPSWHTTDKPRPKSSLQVTGSVEASNGTQRRFPDLVVVHIDHQLQLQSKRWSEAVAAHCATLGIHCEVHKVVVEERGQGLEAAARDARYRLFESLLEEDEALLVAHHLDDQLETFLMRAFRGAGPEGLQAMPAKRALGKGVLVRALLSVPRRELELLAESVFPDYIRDPSNLDERFDRGFLRSQIVPLIRQRWPAAAENVGRAVRLLQQEFSALHPQSADVSRAKTGEPVCLLPADHSSEEQCRMIRAWLKTRGHYPPSHASLSEFVSQIDRAKNDSMPILSSALYRLKYYDEHVYLCPASDEYMAPIVEQEIALNQPLELPLGRFTLVAEGPGDAGSIRVRSRYPGERFALDPKRPSQPVKRLLKEMGVPPWWRDQVPVFERDGAVIGVLDRLVDISESGPDGGLVLVSQIIWRPHSHLE